MTLALLDGDIVAFRAAAGVSQNQAIAWEGEAKTEIAASNPEAAREAALECVEAWQRLAGCKDVLVCFTGPKNFRKTVLPTYKGNRTKGKPLDYWATVEAISTSFPTQVINGLEADDVMGILATTDRFIGDAIVVTQDKDLRTVPGRHLNPVKETSPVLISEAEGDYFWMTQTLTGDPTDHYAGLPKCGPVAAAKILGPCGRSDLEMHWHRVEAAYRAKGLTTSQALQQARVARILRRQDYDKSTKEVLLWHPTTPERLKLATVCA